ncbi:MAG: hypothetical protein LC781_05010 [Actinobacteria bacterium]|nr:hypothetical protein [Actinomycetota bacterium]
MSIASASVTESEVSIAARVGEISPSRRSASSNSRSPVWRVEAISTRLLEKPETPLARRPKAGNATQKYVVKIHQKPGASATSKTPESATGASTTSAAKTWAFGPISSASSPKKWPGPQW